MPSEGRVESGVETRGAYDQLLQQEQRITASMIQGLTMLSLPVQAMYDYLVELSMSNPMLEIPDPPNPGGPEDLRLPEGSLTGFTQIERGRERLWENGIDSGVSGGTDEDFDPFYSQGVGFEPDELRGSLRLQLSMCGLTPLEEAIGQDILGNLDESGFFVGDLNTICLLYRAELETGERVLRRIQGFSPRGIAARDVYEALLLQVDDSFPSAGLVRRIIREDLRVLCDGTPEECAKKFRVSKEEASAAFDYIRTLEPRPGNVDCGRVPVQYTQPDIVVKREGSEFAAYIAGETDAPLRLDDYYLQLMRQPELSSEDRLYLRSCLNSARSLIHSVEIRQQSLHRFALSLISLQGEFFRKGPQALRPLTMQQLADEIGVNVSTVSRIVQDKYISTPFGTFPLKYFFARALPGKEDGFVTADAVRRRIEELIGAESASAPLTDDELCSILSEEGVRISRRTVSKYRQAAGIPGYVKRKRKG